ncbi:MAG: hypothetical protein D8M59_10095 [Planctomycetes bacterium]|nr:hypothetical protein [Planctomycetota bacterium]NOG53391.1 hypothetical protein [Planctomycetota bacterium]
MTMKKKSRGECNLFILISAGAVSCCAAGALAQVEYRVEPIPFPDGARALGAVGLNNSNEVTGGALIDTQVHPYLYSDGQPTILDQVPGINTSGLAVSDASHVSGWMYEWGVIWPTAFLWDGSGNHFLTDPDDSYTYGQGMNDSDQVVGFYYPPNAHPNGDAFVCTDGEYYNLGSGQAEDINNDGIIVGQINRYFGATAVWEPNGNGGWDRTVLDGLLATSVNESGTMFVGAGPIESYFEQAACWNRTDGEWVRTDIGDWDPQVTASIAHDVNDSEQVVGDFQSFEDPDRGWLYENGQVTWLTDLLAPQYAGWEITRAIQINESGVVLAEGSLDGELPRPVLLVPTRLTVLGPRPGLAGEVNEFITTSATSGNRVHFVYGMAEGSRQVPGCSGVYVGIQSPMIFGSAVADMNGEARLSMYVPGAAAGRTVYLQAVEPATCTVSNVLRYEIR